MTTSLTPPLAAATLPVPAILERRAQEPPAAPRSEAPAGAGEARDPVGPAPPGADAERIRTRADQIFEEHRRVNFVRTDRIFVGLMIVQWALGVVFALTISPWTWAGTTRAVHVHVYAALLLGAAVSALPILLAYSRPGSALTRYVIGAAQMLWSALLIHLTGGRIETHFHVFGSLAFLAFYRDWRVLVPATLVVTADHFLRGLLWPESVYGLSNPEWWRFLEHAAWVIFEVTVLVLSCLVGVRETRAVAERQALVEALSESERQKSIELDRVLRELRASQETLVRTERLAAVGELAASVGHELRNPLSAVRNATTYIARRLGAQAPGGPPSPALEPRVAQFFGVIDRELTACSRIISDLLDFARERPMQLEACPLRPLVEEVTSLFPGASCRLDNLVPDGLPAPYLDRDQFRQVLINLVQNAIEAVPAEGGVVAVEVNVAESGDFEVRVRDNGCGIPADIAVKIFEPLFTTKTKGTGLGLAIVANMVRRHRGQIRVESEPGRGTTFVIQLPPAEAKAA